ncbi:MAG TPA: tetratricopeptide repeat protein, partial [Mycobacteriales bacterium]|nr:tetratricopeptide repeat protein [Mycobacteriales bacterium]
MTAIGGSAGIGKTALAVYWAHRVQDRFPGGQLYVNLNGHAATPPMRPVEALARFLRALGVPAERVPVELDEAAALYRSALAGSRTLVLLDNAATAEQVRPLLPGEPGCLVLVTSRDRLSGLAARDGAHRLTLDVLAPAESVALLAAVLGAGRVGREPDAAAELARACGHLPLALRIVGAHLDDNPGRPLAAQAAALAGADRLAALAVDGDPETAVRAAFDLSYATLPADARRLFRLLGLVPGPDVTPTAAAALAGSTVPAAAGLLDRLAAAHLVDQPAPGRYALHDLLRAYAAERAGVEDGVADGGAARFRLLDWYLHTAGAAADQLYPEMLRLALPPAPVGLPAAGIDGHGSAVGWLDGELPNLIAAIIDAAEHGPRPAAWRLADTLRGYFWQSRHAVGWLRAAQAGLAAATTDGDQRAQAALQLSLATAYHSLDRFTDAVTHYTAAAELAGQAGWLDGQAAVLGNLGNVHADRGDLRRAADCHHQALALHRQTKRPAAEAVSLSNLGWLHWQLGRLRQAAGYTAEALARHRQAGSPSGEAHALGNLGVVERDLGLLDQAQTHLDAALTLHRAIGNRYGEAETLQELAALHRDRGEPVRALATAEAAIGLAREIGDRRIETDVLNVLGTLHPDDPAGYHRQELALARQTGSRWSETTALLGLAAAQLTAAALLTAAAETTAAAAGPGPATVAPDPNGDGRPADPASRIGPAEPARRGNGAGPHLTGAAETAAAQALAIARESGFRALEGLA